MKPVLGLIFAILGGGIFGGWGVFLGFLFGWWLGRFGKRSKRSSKAAAKRSRAAAKSAAPVVREVERRPAAGGGGGGLSIVVSLNRLQSESHERLRWVAAGERLRVQGYEISGGMVYTIDGKRNLEGIEASAINPRLPVGRPLRGEASRMDYWPQYAQMSPDQRATYLEWLANGRQDEQPEERSHGYPFLFIYGLERRLLIDRKGDSEILKALVDLMTRYAPYGRSKSLPSYVCQLIHFWGSQQGEDVYERLWPKLVALKHGVVGDDTLALILANMIRRGAPLTADLAWHVASRLDGARRSVILKRVPEEFMTLFRQRFEGKYPSGISLRTAKQPCTYRYQFASPTLMRIDHGPELRGLIEQTLPNVLGINSQFKPLITLWNSCLDDLAAYSRERGKQAALSVKAVAALPPELQTMNGNPAHDRWVELLRVQSFENGRIYMRAGEIARVWGMADKVKLTLGESRDLAKMVVGFGMAIEPDARHTQSSYHWTEEIGLFPIVEQGDAAPSHGYMAAEALTQMCILIAAADGTVDADELEVFHEILDQSVQLSANDHERLMVRERLMLNDPALAAKNLSRIAARIPATKRSVIGEMLVRIAAVDSVITKEERRALAKVYRLLSLLPEQLETTMGVVMGRAGEMTIRPGAPAQEGEAIPPRPRSGTSAGSFALDIERIDTITRQTREVISILAEVMQEEETAMPAAAPSPTALPAATAPPAENVPEWLQGLAPRYHALVLQYAAQTELAWEEFEQACRSAKLMPADAIDTINEWADDALGDFLFEHNDGQVLIQSGLIPQMVE